MITPVTPAEFDALMAPLGPFEPAPALAVAVSGGADSLALALLAAEWAQGRGGAAVGLTVDHGLRPESAAEAARVGAWLDARGIRHHTLVWRGPKPAADLQAAAREARYGLLGEWCRQAGVLHLVLAHHRDDQAETLLLRLGRGSGVDGLAGMAAVQETCWGRHLRPLLAVAPARLRATLAAAGQDWIDDPSNRNPAFARARLRRLMPALDAEGLTSARLSATTRRLGRARDALERSVAEAAARWVRLDLAGYAVIDPTTFAHLPDEIGLRLLSRLLLAVGGAHHTPRLERLEGVHAALRQGPVRARTLAGCRVGTVPAGVLVCREAARVAPPLALVPGAEMAWDGRFRLRVAADAPSGLTLGALGIAGWNRVAAAMRPVRPPAVPAPVRPSLPAIYSEDGVSAVPHLGYNRGTAAGRALRWIIAAPFNPLTVAGRCLV